MRFQNGKKIWGKKIETTGRFRIFLPEMFLPILLLGPDVAFKITAFDEPPPRFEVHARGLLEHVELRTIAWLNVAVQEVTFTTLE